MKFLLTILAILDIFYPFFKFKKSLKNFMKKLSLIFLNKY